MIYVNGPGNTIRIALKGIDNGWHWKSFLKFPIYLFTRGWDYYEGTNGIYYLTIKPSKEEELADGYSLLMIMFNRHGIDFTYHFAPS